ncbi:tRNA (5-methylaminomethyl-2-thiouridine)(34)-methyltransferase MnmD [Lewinella sp. IMCC34191]|uniref:tRNA (5-methylaminomethyl-2-thiouridine)(34)-methyltransferase MnmD n=1 Tax=Lewinella sp. IMCC34191 TaxID=2259172 RepID=UPI000E24EDED|nr:tRNA (5-methylaminomethyl-2-thiouridine)(34)-methyltransferase MnmD [Lewinella sp. IMCC34191]
MQGELFLTKDGSHSLRSLENPALTYHSTHGAINESRHVFVEAGLRRLLDDGKTEIRILEMGFGTGLNALLTLTELSNYPHASIYYDTYELFPIDEEQAGKLNYPQQLGINADTFQALHQTEFGIETLITDRFHFRKYRENFLDVTPSPVYDLIYYDAFAPEDQPELWTASAMERCATWLKPGGALVTYCAKGQFKRNLRAAGFRVKALPGPVGKREITLADLVDLA